MKKAFYPVCTSAIVYMRDIDVDEPNHQYYKKYLQEIDSNHPFVQKKTMIKIE